MARKDKTYVASDVRGMPLVVRLPPSDLPNSKQAVNNGNKTRPDGSVEATITEPSNENFDKQSKHPAASEVQRRIVVNIPSSGRYSRDPAPTDSTNPSSCSPVCGTASNAHSRSKFTKPYQTTKASHLSRTSQPSTSAQFKAIHSNKSRLLRSERYKHLGKSKALKGHRTAAMTSPPQVGASFSPSPSPSPSPSAQMGVHRPTTRPAFPHISRGRGDPRNVAMREARARSKQDLSEEGARKPLHNNIYSSVPSPKPRAPNYQRTSSSESWNDFAAKTSGQTLNRTPSWSPQKAIGNRPRHDTMPHHTAPSARRSRATDQRAGRGPVARRWEDWASWPEVRVKIFGLTADITTSDLWRCFSKEGKLVTIELFEDSRGTRDGKGQVRFSPPPAKAFWLSQPFAVHGRGTGDVYVRLELEPPRSRYGIKSPVNDAVLYPEAMVMHLESIDFGIMYDPQTMMSMHSVYPTASSNMLFRQSMRYKEIVVEMTLQMRHPQSPQYHTSKIGRNDRDEVVRLKIPFSQLEVIHQVPTSKDKVALLITLETPPRFYRKVDESSTHDNGRYWTEQDAWFRQTDIVYDPMTLRSASLTLKKTKPVIDIGRWTTYRLVLDMTRNDRHLFSRMCQALRDHNIDLKPFQDCKLIKDREPAVWDYIDKPLATRPASKHPLEELIQPTVPQLTFPVRYQLEVCISQGILNENNLSRHFINSLIQTNETRAQDLLEYVANQKKRVWDPMQIFSMRVIKGAASRSGIPPYCVYIRSATVTPSTVYYNTPTVEISNRVIRQYAQYADRFLRVRFTDEKFQARINPTDKDTMNEVFTRVKRTMVNGIMIGNRKYDFLAFGNSQFREHGAYFFAPVGQTINAGHIRQWMGLFSDIKIVAKHAARLGQCFSTTRAISCPSTRVVEIQDIKRNGHTFSDGVGKISAMLATITAAELGIMTPDPPSVFQFRLGGCKGVLAVCPDAEHREIHIRESQYKFPAMHEGLEIIRWSQMSSANLNRQLILVLSALGVADDVFIGKLKLQLANLEQAMTDEKAALSLLQKDIDPNQMTLCLAGMIIDGFQRSEEPFLKSLLHLWRAWSIKYLKEKARISISKGALLLGCMDETATLKGHFNHVDLEEATTIEEKVALLPEVFVQLSSGVGQKPQVITGPILLARNPSLHPGDIRVVRGVDVPALRHLKDAVVLPQTGDRDLPGMCSGGDLDGDDYLAMWDEDLLPLEWNHEPMDYTPPDPVELSRNVTIDDLTSFFVTYMKNNTLPSIANAHVAQADCSDDGVKDDKCLKLAALHSMAVDYVKTGTPARMTSDLRPRKWPHFMEKEHKPAEQIYHSRKILGQLYDQVDRVDFVPTFDKTFDQRILKAYKLSPEMLNDAAEVKQQYDDAVRRIMAQHDIKTEFEVWSTFVLQHSNDFRDFKFHEEIGNLAQSLKDQFRKECRERVKAEDFEGMLHFVAAMYTVTAQEMDLALSECRQMVMVGGVETPLRKMVPSNMPLMSFPWLFPHYLGQIANGDNLFGNADAFVAPQGEKYTPPKKAKAFIKEGEDTIIETAEGTTHRGENLILFDDWIDVEQDIEEKQALPTASSVPGSSSSTGQLVDISGQDKASQNHASQTPSAGGSRIKPQDLTSSSSELISNSPDMDRVKTTTSQLLRDDAADVGTLSRALTPASSATTSRCGHDGFDSGKENAGPPLGGQSPDESNGSSLSLKSNEVAKHNGYSAGPELAASHQAGTGDSKTADSSARQNKPGEMKYEDEWKSGSEGGGGDEEEAEEVEVVLDTKPSYVDRLSLLNLD